MKTVAIFCLALVLGPVGCGVFSSGTWEDDPGNWERAFRSKKPDDVVVLHSKYWRSPHWTYEFQYFFEVQRNGEFQKRLFTHNPLVRLQGGDAVRAKRDFFGEAPDWFAPKPIDEYEIWVYADEPRGNFRLFVDKRTGHLFLTDYSV